MDFVVGLGDEFQVRAGQNFKAEILPVPVHDPSGGGQQHDLNAPAFFFKGEHDLVGSSKSRAPKIRLSVPAGSLQAKTGYFSELVCFHRIYIPSSSTFSLIQAITSSTCSPPRMLVKMKGRSPLIFLESRSITERSAPT